MEALTFDGAKIMLLEISAYKHGIAYMSIMFLFLVSQILTYIHSRHV